MIEINDDAVIFDLFDHDLDRTAVFALSVKRHALLQVDARKLFARNILGRFRVILAVGICRFDEHIAFFADTHLFDPRFEARDDLPFAEHKNQRLAADVRVDDITVGADFIFD